MSPHKATAKNPAVSGSDHSPRARPVHTSLGRPPGEEGTVVALSKRFAHTISTTVQKNVISRCTSREFNYVVDNQSRAAGREGSHCDR